jgi:hypothetical protein
VSAVRRIRSFHQGFFFIILLSSGKRNGKFASNRQANIWKATLYAAMAPVKLSILQ